MDEDWFESLNAHQIIFQCSCGTFQTSTKTERILYETSKDLLATFSSLKSWPILIHWNLTLFSGWANHFWTWSRYHSFFRDSDTHNGRSLNQCKKNPQHFTVGPFKSQWVTNCHPIKEDDKFMLQHIRSLWVEWHQECWWQVRIWKWGLHPPGR